MKDIATLINPLHLEDLRNPIHPSIFDENPEYDVFIVRLPEPGKTLQIESVGFVITTTKCYLFDKATDEFRELEGRFMGAYGVIDPLIDRLLKNFARYQEQVADMEELLYEDTAGPGFMTDWLALKRDILRIERVLARTNETLEQMMEYYEALEEFPIDSYTDLHEHTDRVARSAVLHLGKLDYIYNFHNARTNEKMNRLIYLLTVISAIFLPLNLVVGFFGMNTGGLPFAQNESGTISAVGIMASLLAVTLLILIAWYKKRTRAPE